MCGVRAYLTLRSGAGAVIGAAQEADVLSGFQTVGSSTAARHGTAAMTASAVSATSDDLLDVAMASLDTDKAEEIVKISLKGKSEMGDWMLICTGRSSRQVTSIAEKLCERLKSDCGVIAKVEGRETGDWVLVDAGDIIVHIFRPEVREFYQLEKMWAPNAAHRDPDRSAGTMDAVTDTSPETSH